MRSRRSIVTIFTSPVIKQQTNLAGVIQNISRLVDEVPDGKFLLGIETETKFSDETIDLEARNASENLT